MLLENRVSRDMPVYAIIHFSYLAKFFFFVEGAIISSGTSRFFRIGLGPMIGFFFVKNIQSCFLFVEQSKVQRHRRRRSSRGSRS